MNPEQLLNAVETCIKDRPKSYADSWVIIWHCGQLKCLVKGTIKTDANIFLELKYDDLITGLTLDQWSSVAKKITEFFERTPQCPVPLKP